MLLIVAGLILWLGVLFLAMAVAPASGHSHPPPEFFILMPVLWLSLMGMGLMVLLAAIVYGVRAGRGEWAEYPILGQLALKILKLRTRRRAGVTLFCPQSAILVSPASALH